MTLPNKYVLALTLACGLAAQYATAATEPVQRIGTEFRVNTFLDDEQRLADVAVDADGDFVVVWESSGQDEFAAGIYAQRYARDGTPAGDELRVHTDGSGSEQAPSVAMDFNGNFTVVWQVGAGSNSIRAQRFAANGTRVGTEVLIDVDGVFRDPGIAMAPGGQYVVIWRRSNGAADGMVLGQRFNADGTVNGPQFKVSSDTVDSESEPEVAMAADGSFVVVWRNDDDPDRLNNEIFARRFDANGTALGNSFQVNTGGSSSDGNPSVGINADGVFIVAWYRPSAPTGAYARRYAAGGVPLGGEFRVDNESRGSDAGDESIGTLVYPDGSFLIVWNEANIDGNGEGIFGQLFNADGTKFRSERLVDTEFMVNTTTDGAQDQPAIAGDANGNAVVVWRGDGPGGIQDDIYAQRYSSFLDVDLSLVKQDAADPVAAGGNIAYTLIVTNSEPAATNPAVGSASGIRLTDTLPAGVTLVSASGTDWNCTPAGSVVDCLYQASLAPTTSTIVEIVVQAPATAGSLTNSAFVSGEQFDANEANAAGSNNFDQEATMVAATGGGGAPGTLAFSQPNIEVNEGAGTVSITVMRSSGSTGAVTVSYATAPGTATAPADFTATAGTLSLADGVTSQSFAVPLVDDALVESSEAFSVQLSNPAGGASLGAPGQATVTIIDNDAGMPPPGGDGVGAMRFTQPSYQINENTGALTVMVERINGSTGTVSVSYATAPGTAAAPQDYTATSGTLSFGEGVTTQSLTIPIVDDSIDEPSERFSVVLSNPTGGATFGTPSVASIEILDNDPPASGGAPPPARRDSGGGALGWISLGLLGAAIWARRRRKPEAQPMG